MYTILALFAFLAAANAGAILLPETKVETIPVVKTSIEGPSGHITQEEHLPVLTHDKPTLIETPVVRLHDFPVVVPHHELPVSLPHEVFPVHPIVDHDLPTVVYPQVPLVHPEVPFAPHFPINQAVFRTVPHVVRYPSLYRTIGLYHH